MLLTDSPADHDRARDMVASLLTRHKGEYVFRIGSLPPLGKLMSGESINGPGWTGTSRTQEEIDTLHRNLTNIVEEVGGKVSILFDYRTDHSRIALLLRLPPLSIAHTPEVRCAVVGNVDRLVTHICHDFMTHFFYQVESRQHSAF